MGRRYVVVGCGGVGGLYGARLAAAGHDVTFLVRSETDLHVLAGDGLRLDSIAGDVQLAAGSFGVTRSVGDVDPPDAVILAVKTTTPVDVTALLGPATTLAVFQNGLGVEEAADRRAPGAGAVVGGLCFVCSAKVAPGHISHVDYGQVTVAPWRGDLASAEAIADDLRGAGFVAEATADLVTARWRKLLWNVPFNGLTALLDVGTDELLANAAGRDLAVSIMEEVVAAARACGADLGGDDLRLMLGATEAMVPYRTSMALDLAAGRPLEHEAIHGAAVRAASGAGVAVPRIEALWRALDVLDRRTTA